MSARVRGALETAAWWLLIASCCILLGGGCASSWKPVILSGFVAWKEAPPPTPGEQQRWVLVVVIPPQGRVRIEVPLRVFGAFQPGEQILLRGATNGNRLRVEAVGKVIRPAPPRTPPARAIA